MALATVAFAAGFGSFGAVASLGEVAKAFGHATGGQSVSSEMGLSGSVLGLGLAVLRIASLGGLPLAVLADRFGRRSTILAYTTLGLACTVVAAFSPSYWFFVAVFALGRPLLSAAVSIAHVAGAELTSSSTRAGALALLTGGYGIGAGAAALVHTTLEHAGGFRVVFGLALVPLLVLAWAKHRLVEPARWHRPEEWAHAIMGRVAAAQRRRLLTVMVITFSVAAASGPANGYVFLYADNVVRASAAATATMVGVASVTGLGGLLLGRAGADRLGRRPVVVVASVAFVLASLVLYEGGTAALIVGYLCSVAAAGALAPAGSSWSNELFPTSVRASVAGWNLAASVAGSVLGLLVFGWLVDATGSFEVAAACTFVPTLAVLGLVATLPETVGREPEQLWSTP
jgi:MFS family permease